MFQNKLLSNSFFKNFVSGVVRGGLIGLVSFLGIGIQPKSVEAYQMFRDEFDDGIVDTSVYSSINGAVISESNGRMDVALNTVGDGILISLDNTNFEVNCFELLFKADLFGVGQGINIDFLLSGVEKSNDDLTVSFSITQTSSMLAQVSITTKDGTIVAVKNLKFPDLIINGNHTVTYDPKIFSAGWKVDNGGGADKDILKFFQDYLNRTISDKQIENKGIKQVTIDLISTTNRDPSISINTIQAQDTHAVLEPPTILGLVAAMGFGAFFKPKRKLSESSENKNTKVS